MGAYMKAAQAAGGMGKDKGASANKAEGSSWIAAMRQKQGNPYPQQAQQGQSSTNLPMSSTSAFSNFSFADLVKAFGGK